MTLTYRYTFPLLTLGAALLSGCGQTQQAHPATAESPATTPAAQATAQIAETNPLLAPSDALLGLPPFAQIRSEHFRPAFDEALQQHRAELEAIATNSEPASFANTVVALERSGKLLQHVSTVLANINAANATPQTQELTRQMAPVLSAHRDSVYLNQALFDRLQAVYDAREALALNAEDARLLEETYRRFARAGAALNPADKEKLAVLNAELSVLTTQFNQNLLDETRAYQLVIDNEADLAGIPETVKAAAAQTAAARGLEGKWVFTLAHPSVTPFLSYADNRELRQQIWQANQMRGNNGNDADNKEVLRQIANLRLERAQLLGHASHAEYTLANRMAQNTHNVRELLDRVWPLALEKARTEAADIEAQIRKEGGTFAPAPYDWQYYAEKIRAERFAFDQDELRPYFSLPAVRDGAFSVANALYGLSFTPLPDAPVYHPDVQAYLVRDKDGSYLGVLYLDFFARESKRGGNWMTFYRRQSREGQERIAPVVTVVCNFTPPVGDAPALLSQEEAIVLFHEFGHALHGLLSNVTYSSLSGTAVPTDFVEMPSRMLESWSMQPEVLRSYARHYVTGEPIPDELIAKMQRVGTFNKGFATVENLAASYLDLAYHDTTEPLQQPADTFEAEVMAQIGLIDAIIPRYRSTYFRHIFAGGYSAGYYSYMWAEIIAADAFAAFSEAGLFDQQTAHAFRTEVLEKGNTAPAATLYQNFRGKAPDPAHFMKGRGLD